MAAIFFVIIPIALVASFAFYWLLGIAVLVLTDAGYWSDDAEKQLREAIEIANNSKKKG